MKSLLLLTCMVALVGAMALTAQKSDQTVHIPDVRCPSGQMLYGFRGGAPMCSAVGGYVPEDFKCPQNSVATGFKDGKLACKRLNFQYNQRVWVYMSETDDALNFSIQIMPEPQQ